MKCVTLARNELCPILACETMVPRNYCGALVEKVPDRLFLQLVQAVLFLGTQLCQGM